MSFLFGGDDSEPMGQDVGQQTYGGSSYGQSIPRIFGCIKIPANLIWLGTVIPTTTSSNQGGKGGGGVTTTSTTYAASLAVELCSGPIVGVAQIWADSTLVYNATTLSNSADLATSKQFMASYLSNYGGLHLGSSVQVPDALMAQALAPGLNYSANAYVNYVNVCPAYRDLAYLVLNMYPFGSNSGRVPSIEVEVCSGPNVSVTTNGDGVKVVTRGAGCPASYIITNICIDAGIDPSDLDIDVALDSILIPGLRVYGDKRQSALEALMQGFDIGFCESGSHLKFFPLFRAVAVNIPFTDVATTTGKRGQQMVDPYPFVDVREIDLPYQVNVQFKNNGLVLPEGSTIPQTSYDDCTQGYQRIYGSATAVVNVDLGDLALDTTTGAKIANKQLYRAWIERLMVQPIMLSRKYLNLEPNDIFTTTYGGKNLTFRSSKISLGSNYSIELEAVQYNTSSSSSIAAGATPWGSIGQTTPLGTNPIFYPLNLPALQSLQAQQQGFYCAAAWTGGQGKPAAIYSSLDSFGHIKFETSVLQSAITGSVVGTLAGANYYRIDNTNSLVITLDNPDSNFQIANATLEDLEVGQNLIYIGTTVDNVRPPFNQFEILQALNVSFNSDRTEATFTGLLRGRKGTENYVSSHVSGEKFIFLSGTGVAFIESTQSWVNNARFELELLPPGVTSDTSLAAFTFFKPNNNNMLPLNPRFFRGAQTGFVVDFSWFRRTRYDAPILQRGGVPCGETVEAYRLIIFKPDGTRVVNRDYSPTIQLSAPVTFQYTQTMRHTDFGSDTFDLTGYTVKVCQMSTVAGEGNPSTNSFTFTQ